MFQNKGFVGLYGAVVSKKSFVAVILTLVLVVIYNLNGRDSDSVDAVPATLLPVSLLTDRDTRLNEFQTLFQPQPKLLQAAVVFGAVQKKDGDLISSYPLGGALLATPFYAVAQFFGVLDYHDWMSYRLTAKLTASIMVAVSAAVLFLVLIQLMPLPGALWLSLAYGLGTGAFSIASQAMWQHAPGMLCLSLVLLGILNLDRRAIGGTWVAFATGLALALAVICRNLNIFAAIAFTLYMLVYQRRLLLPYLLPLACFAAWLLHYNYTHFSNFTGGYDAILNSQWHRSRNLLETGMFNHPLGQGLLDTWLSPSKGVLIYTPFIAFAFAPLVLKVTQHRRLMIICYIWLVLAAIVIAKNTLWWGGTSFGPRYFLELLIVMIFLIGLIYQKLPVTGRYTLNGLIMISMMIHTLGVFYAPCGWADKPTWADFHPDRYRDWSDTEIERCLARGLQEGPLPPIFFVEN